MPKIKEKNIRYKLLFLSPPFESRGGVSDFCRILVKFLNKDFQITHLSVGSGDGRHIFFFHLYNFIKTLFLLLTTLLRSNYDVIHLNPSFKIYSLLRDYFYLFLFNFFGLMKKTVIFFHGWNQHLVNIIASNFFTKILFCKLYGKAEIIFVLYRSCKDQLSALGIEPSRIKIITTMYEGYNGLHYNKIKRDSLSILFMSRLLKEKGVYITIKVAELLEENNYKNFKLFIAGDGPELNNLKIFLKKKKLEDYVKILGYLRGEKKKEILKKSDIFLFPTSYAEGCPVAVIEALGAGLAVISTPVAAIPSLIKQNENGFLVNSSDPQDFFKAVKILFDHRDLLSNIQKINRKKAEENYEARVVTRKIESFYYKIVKNYQ